jgi:serine/threonine protein kinase
MAAPAEQIIAGVVLSERLAVTMYGAIHRAQWSGSRDLRGLVIDAKILDDASFRASLTDERSIASATDLAHDNIVPTIAVESGGADVVMVTRGVGRYVTVQDLIAAARANRREGGKLAQPVAAAIAKSVATALSVAHRAGVVHGAVHPRSVLVDEDGGVRLGDFIVGKALTTAVAKGADSALWRGLAGYLAPELVVGEAPTTACDVFACGAMLFTMLSGEVPPGTLHVSPAVERLVQRALDTDLVRRYKHAGDLLENLVEALEDDRWEIADPAEVIQAAGLARADSRIDEATEDLLASLGSAPSSVQRPRPTEARVELPAPRPQLTPTGAVAMRRLDEVSGGGLDAVLDDLDDERPAKPDIDVRELAVQAERAKRPRVPSLDDPDDDTPLPPPAPFDPDIPIPSLRRDEVAERAAIDALAGLESNPPKAPKRPDSRSRVEADTVAPRVASAASSAASSCSA